MRGFFDYDNKFMQMLSKATDMIILNLLFLLCCIPIFTIGAAQAALYTALRVMMDPEDDTSLIAAFFRGFKNGFGTITVAFVIMTVLTLLAGFCTFSVIFSQGENVSIIAVLGLVGVLLCAVLQSLIPVFHSRFRCTLWQLFRNSWLVFLANPLRGLLICILSWSHVVIFLVNMRVFMMMMPVFLILYFSVAHWLCRKLINKPFATLEKLHTQPQEAEDVPAESNQ